MIDARILQRHFRDVLAIAASLLKSFQSTVLPSIRTDPRLSNTALVLVYLVDCNHVQHQRKVRHGNVRQALPRNLFRWGECWQIVNVHVPHMKPMRLSPYVLLYHRCCVWETSYQTSLPKPLKVLWNGTNGSKIPGQSSSHTLLTSP